MLVEIAKSRTDRVFLPTQPFYNEPRLRSSFLRSGSDLSSFFCDRQDPRPRHLLMHVSPNFHACHVSIFGDHANRAQICFPGCDLEGKATDNSTVPVVLNATTTELSVCPLTVSNLQPLLTLFPKAASRTEKTNDTSGSYEIKIRELPCQDNLCCPHWAAVGYTTRRRVTIESRTTQASRSLSARWWRALAQLVAKGSQEYILAQPCSGEANNTEFFLVRWLRYAS
jgi:hypothetical protein